MSDWLCYPLVLELQELAAQPRLVNLKRGPSPVKQLSPVLCVFAIVGR